MPISNYTCQDEPHLSSLDFSRFQRNLCHLREKRKKNPSSSTNFRAKHSKFIEIDKEFD